MNYRNETRSIALAGVYGGPAAGDLRSALHAGIAAVARSLRAYRRRQARRHLPPLDPRTARDLGVTPLGVSEKAVAVRNERGAGWCGR